MPVLPSAMVPRWAKWIFTTLWAGGLVVWGFLASAPKDSHRSHVLGMVFGATVGLAFAVQAAAFLYVRIRTPKAYALAQRNPDAPPQEVGGVSVVERGRSGAVSVAKNENRD